MKTAHKTKPSAEEINQAIAEALGWVWYRLPEYRYETRKHRFLALPSIHEYEGQDPAWTVRADMTENVCNWEYMQREFHVPNYWGDLNAIHEAEKMLTEKQQVWYLQKLTQIRFRDGVSGMIGCMIDKTTFATAPQRCEAFLRTLGKWRWV
jgi:hypothetical protein